MLERLPHKKGGEAHAAFLTHVMTCFAASGGLSRNRALRAP
jgi:hypothetical protein